MSLGRLDADYLSKKENYRVLLESPFEEIINQLPLNHLKKGESFDQDQGRTLKK